MGAATCCPPFFCPYKGLTLAPARLHHRAVRDEEVITVVRVFEVEKLARMGLVVEGTTLRGTEVTPVKGGVIIRVGSRARMSQEATCFLAEENFPRVVVLIRDYNARRSAVITGPAVAWWYADDHGMCLVAVLRRGHEFRMSIPGHHGRGSFEYEGVVEADGTIRLHALPPQGVKTIEV